MTLLAGGVTVLAASFLGGVTGFGYSLVAAPLLLLLGFPLPFVVTVNLALACVTRMSVAYRFRADLNVGRATGLEVLRLGDYHVVAASVGAQLLMLGTLLLAALLPNASERGRSGGS